MRKGWGIWDCFVCRKMRRYLIDAYKCLKAECQEDESRHLSVVPSNMIRDIRPKWKHRKFALSMRKKSLLWGWQSTQTDCPGCSLLLWRYSKPACTVQHVLGGPASAGSWTRQFSEVLSNNNHSSVLEFSVLYLCIWGVSAAVPQWVFLSIVLSHAYFSIWKKIYVLPRQSMNRFVSLIWTPFGGAILKIRTYQIRIMVFAVILI